jgi:hypothetical protein
VAPIERESGGKLPIRPVNRFDTSAVKSSNLQFTGQSRMNFGMRRQPTGILNVMRDASSGKTLIEEHNLTLPTTPPTADD